MSQPSASELTPAQQKIVDEVIAPNATRPSFDEKLSFELRRALEDSLSDVDIAISKEQMIITKSMLAQIHSCEGHFIAEEGNFAWSVPTATGTVAHKGVELSFAMREDRPPADLVDIAIDRLMQEGSRGTPAEWLKAADPGDIADLRLAAIDRVSKFLDTFPPLSNDMRPRFESSLYSEVMDKAIMLRGKVDLALFKATGNTAGVLIIELKTGRPSSHHFDDLRYYALLETLRSGVPPYRVATLYLDSGTYAAEDTTEELLLSGVRRVSEGIRKIIEVRNSAREIQLTPGPVCFYCTDRASCPRGSEFEKSLQEN